MMNLASAAPRVEPATALAAERSSAVKVDMPSQSEAPKVDAAPRVEAAIASYREQSRNPTTIDTRPALSVAALRGGSGSDFEGYAAVFRGAPKRGFFQRLMMCIFDCRLPGSSLDRDFIAYGEAKKFVLVKGTSCFIYGEEHDPSPLYAIPLEDVYAVLEDPDAPDPMSVTVNPRPSDHKPRDGMVTVLLKYRSDGSQAYQVTFDTSSDRTLAKRFIDILDHVNAKKGGDVGASVVYAELVGQEAKKAQPDI